MPINVCTGPKSEHCSSTLNPLPEQRLQKAQTALAKALPVHSTKSNPDGSLLRDVHHHIRMCNEVLKGVLQAHNNIQELFSRLKWPLPSLHCSNAHGRDIKQTLTMHLIKWGLSTVSLSVLTQRVDSSVANLHQASDGCFVMRLQDLIIAPQLLSLCQDICNCKRYYK